MNFKQVKLIVRVLVSKIFIYYLFKRYVVHNSILKEDIIQNFKIRSSKAEVEKLYVKFSHLLIYYPEFSFVFFWRIQSDFFLWRWLFKNKELCKIFISSEVSGGLVAYHPYATIINAQKIGKNFIFRNSLTIGNKNNDNRLLPVIGDNVEVGANVVIIGDIEIGDNVIIGAGSVVVKSIPSNSVVAGNPAKIIKRL